MENIKIIAFVLCLVSLLVAVSITFYKDNHHHNDQTYFERPIWGYKWENSKCKRTKVTEENFSTLRGFETCRIFCGAEIGTLWPRPRGSMSYEKDLVKVNLKSISWKINNSFPNLQLFKDNLRLPKNLMTQSGGKSLVFDINLESNDLELNIDTAEEYKLKIEQQDDSLTARIEASTFYGARHALETISQLIIYDDLKDEYQMPSKIEIIDSPKFKHRGISFDTSRNFYDKETLKRTLDGLAMVKMNTFHWHVTDSESFPLFLKLNPDLAKFGAYSRNKVYWPEYVTEIVQYAKSRGIRIIPEFDSPAHVAEGWQFTDFLLCYNMQPWMEFCANPPCGQFNPSKDKLYDVLENLYRDYKDLFGDFDMFHVGGDEVNINCWNTSTELQNWMLEKGWNLNEDGFMELWAYYQEKSLERFDRVFEKKVPIILWTSSLTEEPYLTKHLKKDRYIIQIWSKGSDPRVKILLEKGYKVIVSNYDGLYLDCGFPSPVKDGFNWCSPYVGWQKVYDNKIENIAGEYFDQVLGAEATLWSEQIDENNLDSRLWPRVSALAERLWSNPENLWKQADSRMLIHRKRLVENRFKADRLQPEWCLQNEDECPIKS